MEYTTLDIKFYSTLSMEDDYLWLKYFQLASIPPKDFWLIIKPFFTNAFQENIQNTKYEDCKIYHPNINTSRYFQLFGSISAAWSWPRTWT
ncbi:hypothetical protein SAMN05661044_05452 [Olivibacter domesticus]|uniref:Uncharacterized protein n=1 Tax=Olivibacter domesticus TaxID=407022 RepID=A0A1H7Z8B0_OLID1|nr:hypothetical protein SAMN05661044_05452 [Olivibacter domesticus]